MAEEGRVSRPFSLGEAFELGSWPHAFGKGVIGMRPRLLGIALLAAFTAGAEPQLPVDQPPFGLSCTECSLAPGAECSVLWTAPVVAEARDARIRSANRQCYRVQPGSPETCDVVESVTFGTLRYFRRPSQIPDRFRVLHSTGEVRAEEAGIVIAPSVRYVLFAAPSDGALSVTAACAVDESRELR